MEWYVYCLPTNSTYNRHYFVVDILLWDHDVGKTLKKTNAYFNDDGTYITPERWPKINGGLPYLWQQDGKGFEPRKEPTPCDMNHEILVV